MIPRIIHQTWKSNRIPKRFQMFIDEWRRFHPGWEWRLWTDLDNTRFVEEHYQPLLEKYISLPFNIQRVDFVRYLILRTYGGIYADLDLQCFRNIEPLLGNFECVFSLEHESHAERHDVPFIVSNAFIATIPNHPIFDRIVNEILSHTPPTAATSNQLILESTGPLMLTRVFQTCPTYSGLELLGYRHLFSLPLSMADKVRASDLSQLSLIFASDIYGLHWHDGTWWRNNRLGKLYIQQVRSKLLSLLDSRSPL